MSERERCAGQVQGDDDVIAGCPDDASVMVPASGTRAQDGARYLVALCADHAELALVDPEMTFTLILGEGSSTR